MSTTERSGVNVIENLKWEKISNEEKMYVYEILKRGNVTGWNRSHGRGNDRAPTESAAHMVRHHVQNMYVVVNACCTGKR